MGLRHSIMTFSSSRMEELLTPDGILLSENEDLSSSRREQIRLSPCKTLCPVCLGQDHLTCVARLVMLDNQVVLRECLDLVPRWSPVHVRYELFNQDS